MEIKQSSGMNSCHEQGQVIILNRVVLGGSIEKVTFEQRLEEIKGRTVLWGTAFRKREWPAQTIQEKALPWGVHSVWTSVAGIQQAPEGLEYNLL
jgi:hypothetical protein